MARIHPFAVISPTAQLGRDVAIGPFCVIEDDVVLGDGCRLGSHVVLKAGVVLGANNRIADAAVLGGTPQHLKADGPFGNLIIGENNTIREHVTFHVAMSPGKSTVIGDNNLFMAGSHIAHDVRVGNNAVLVNGVLMGGHSTIEDRAYLGGGVGVHQFCRVGRNCMIGAHARIVQDVPPYMMVDGDSAKIVGLNLVGLRRAGFSAEEIAQLKLAYRTIYRSGLMWDEILAALERDFATGPAAHFHAFLASGNRGFIQERRSAPRPTLKIAPTESSDPAQDSPSPSRKVG